MPSNPSPAEALPKEPGTATKQHFYSLDVVRGLGALSIVLWHWKHFFYVGLDLKDLDFQRLPFYGVLQPLYLDGVVAVPLFFCLSGFIFFWLYSEKVASHALPPMRFAILRLSRLYPLHLLTLLFVAMMQAVFLRSFGSHFVYWRTDAVHFALQLIMASNWLPAAFTFNGPSWSVSVEVLLYGVFFFLSWSGWQRWWKLLFPMAAGYLGATHGDAPLGVGLVAFFAGGLTYKVYAHLARRPRSSWTLPGLVLGALVAWLASPYLFHPERLAAFFQSWPGHTGGAGATRTLAWNLGGLAPELLLFPLTILTLALAELQRGTLGRRLSFLGQISYSCYLLHFPLQMTLVLITRKLGVPTTFFYTPTAFLLFFSLLLPLAFASFHCFELPCQNWLRKRLLAREAAAIRPVGTELAG